MVKCSSSSHGKKKKRKEKYMIVKDLLVKCVPEDVASIITAEQFDITEEKRHRVIDVYVKMYQELLGLTPVSTDRVAFGMGWKFKGKEDYFVALYEKKEIKEKFKTSISLDSIKNVKEIKREDAEDILRSYSFPDTYSFLFTPWSEIIGYEVDKENIREFGAEKFLACLLFEISFFGFSEKDIQAEKIKVDELLAEAMKLINKTEYISEEEADEDEEDITDALFKDLADGLQDNRSEEEKEEDIREMLFNAKVKYALLKRYLSKNKKERC